MFWPNYTINLGKGVWIYYVLLENVGAFRQFASMPENNFPPTEERAGPEGAEEEPPRVITAATSAPMSGNNTSTMQTVEDEEDIEDEDEGEEQCKTEITSIVLHDEIQV